MLKHIVVGLGILVVFTAIIHFVEVGDAIKVVAREGEVCGCMYDNTGFKDCIDDGTVEYVVIKASHCK